MARVKRTWPDINGWAVIAFIVATVRGFWHKNQAPPTPKANVLPFAQGSLLEQGKKHTGELAGKVVTDGKSATGEGSLKVSGKSWWLRFIGKVSAEREKKPDVSAEVEFQKRWFGGW